MLVGVAQIEPRLGEVQRNLERCLTRMDEAAAQGARLLVLPECALTGYVFDSPDEARAHALETPGPELAELASACASLDLHVVCGLVAQDGDRLRNRAWLIGPDGLVGTYDKSHLPYLGVDRFVDAGDDLPVFETAVGRIGVEICYDLRFPEATRLLALAGAELVALPTNWPVEATTNAELLTRARAYENRVFLLVSNRVGRERTAEFCGWSQIVDPAGARLAEADAVSEALLLADVEPAAAREKSIVPAAGEYEMHLFDHRRPDLYGALAAQSGPVTAR
jgi:predicted amidohydrolase